MIFDLMATNGGGMKYFTKDGVIYTDLICADTYDTEDHTWLTVEDSRLKWRSYHTEYGYYNSHLLGVENIDLTPYKKIFVTIPEYVGYYYDADAPSGSDPNTLTVYVLNSIALRPPNHNAMWKPEGSRTFITQTIHPKQKYFEIDVSDINEVCQIWLDDNVRYNTEHILYITEFGVK